MNAPADRLVDIFNEAKALPAGASRDQFVDASCGEDERLRARLVRLLAADESAGEFLTPTPLDRQSVRITERPGDWIDRYKLIEKIGEGGCGVVYLAEQEQPVRRRVALKVIKLGMDTKQVVARFEAERQALALMDHPNIAKVFDGGATETGRPYFVMELVRGIKITEFCDQNSLPTDQRLDLFIQVCQAIQHAHQKGIVHRDIKPSNILVTVDDGVPVPKVIDFGIAKATEQSLTDKTVHTAVEQFIGTPAYMSPEQAAMTSVDIDTRSDIYSLGVLLYELLTGNTPFDVERLVASGLTALCRTIRESEPASPSTRLGRLTRAELTTVATRRGTDAPRLIHRLRGDLDWIVMKCLEKDRARRYETTSGLARDLKRHLRDEPVLARPPSRAYQFHKLVRRNKLVFAAASAVVLALVLGIIASTIQAVRATRAEREQSVLRNHAQASQRKSETEAAKSKAISDFLQQVLSSANPDALKKSDYTFRQFLGDFSDSLGTQLGDQPEVEAALRTTVGRAYRRLGFAENAQSHHERALMLRRGLFGGDSEPVAESLSECAWAFHEQGEAEKGARSASEALKIYRVRGTSGRPVLHALWALQVNLSVLGRFSEVEALAEEAVAIAEKSPGLELPELASFLQGLAGDRTRQSRCVEAESIALKAVEMQQRARGDQHPETGWALLHLGIALAGQQKLEEAESALREALNIFFKYFLPEHKSVQMTRSELTRVLKSRGDLAGLKALARQRLAEANKRLEQNGANAQAWSERALANAETSSWAAALMDAKEAIAKLSGASLGARNGVALRCLEVAQHAFDAGEYRVSQEVSERLIIPFTQFAQEDPNEADYPKRIGHSYAQLGRTLQKSGRVDEAERAFLAANEVLEKAARDFPAKRSFRHDQAIVRRSLAELTKTIGRVEDAQRHYRAAYELYAALAAEEPQQLGYYHELYRTGSALEELLKKAGLPVDTELQPAIIRLRQANAERAERLGSEHIDVAAALAGMSFLYRERGELAEAERTARESLAIRKKLLRDQPSDIAQSMHLLAWNLHLRGKDAEAEEVSREELAQWRRMLGDKHRNVAWCLFDLAMFLREQGKFPEAEAAIRESLAIRQERFGNSHPDVVRSFEFLSGLLLAQGKPAESLN